MPERLSPGPLRGNPTVKEAVSVHTRKVFDACRDKECIQDTRVYLSAAGQDILASSSVIRPKNASLIWVYTNVDTVPFNKGFYTVDSTYYYKVTAEASSGTGRPQDIEGLASFTKRVILYGSEGTMRTFVSTYTPSYADIRDPDYSMPIAVVDAVEPILLSVKVIDNLSANGVSGLPFTDLPEPVLAAFDEPLTVCPGPRTMLATIGQFSIVKLERETQLLMPSYDTCVPDKVCENSAEDPCEIFGRFSFPVDEFSPPDLRTVRGES